MKKLLSLLLMVLMLLGDGWMYIRFKRETKE